MQISALLIAILQFQQFYCFGLRGFFTPSCELLFGSESTTTKAIVTRCSYINPQDILRMRFLLNLYVIAGFYSQFWITLYNSISYQHSFNCCRNCDNSNHCLSYLFAGNSLYTFSQKFQFKHYCIHFLLKLNRNSRSDFGQFLTFVLPIQFSLKLLTFLRQVHLRPNRSSFTIEILFLNERLFYLYVTIFCLLNIE